MKFKLDENLPEEAARLLADAGHDASTVLQQGLGGKPDAGLAQICRRERRAVMTLDTGFADIRRYPPAEYAGLVVFRLERQDKPHVLSVLERVIRRFTDETLEGKLWIVEEHRVRIRSG